MYADVIQIYVDASKDAGQLGYWLPSQLPQLKWGGKLGHDVYLSPDIQFRLEFERNKDIETNRELFDMEDESNKYMLYPVIIVMWTFTDLDYSNSQVLQDQKQVAQELISFFKSQGWKTCVVSPHLEDDDFV